MITGYNARHVLRLAGGGETFGRAAALSGHEAAAARAARQAEVTIGVKIESIAPNFAARGARSWPLVDSLAQPMGRPETQADGAGSPSDQR